MTTDTDIRPDGSTNCFRLHIVTRKKEGEVENPMLKALCKREQSLRCYERKYNLKWRGLFLMATLPEQISPALVPLSFEVNSGGVKLQSKRTSRSHHHGGRVVGVEHVGIET